MQRFAKGFLGFCSLLAIAILFSHSPIHAQSGVISGPPQVKPGQGPGPGPGQGPGPNYRPGPNTPYGPGPGLSPPGPNVQGPGYGTWIAVVAGFDGAGRRVSVGFSGLQRSKYEAEEAAIRACNNVDRRVFCQNPFAVANGCLYIVPGNKQDGGVRWGRGSTPDAAVAECRRGGYMCPRNRLIGGCLPGYR